MRFHHSHLRCRIVPLADDRACEMQLIQGLFSLLMKAGHVAVLLVADGNQVRTRLLGIGKARWDGFFKKHVSNKARRRRRATQHAHITMALHMIAVEYYHCIT